MLRRILALLTRFIPFVQSRGVITLVKMVLPRDELQTLSALEKKRYLMVTCIMRDLVFLQKHLVFIRRARRHGGAEHSAEACSIVFFLTLLISKIHEARTFFVRNQVLEQTSGLSSGPLEAYNRFFDDQTKRDLVAFVRHKIGFHYEYLADIDDRIECALDGLSRIEMWLSSFDSGNDVFSTSNDVLTAVLVGEMIRLGYQGASQEQQLMNLWRVALEGASVTVEFCRAYLAEAFNVTWEEREQVELLVPRTGAVAVPMLCAR